MFHNSFKWDISCLVLLIYGSLKLTVRILFQHCRSSREPYLIHYLKSALAKGKNVTKRSAVCVLTEDALVDMVFSSNVRKCRKLWSDYVTLRDLCVQLSDRLEWSA